jgi:hypothetical protein
MRGVSKQNAIKGARLKLIKIVPFQNKTFASKRPKMRDNRLATEAKLKGVKCRIEHRPSHLN